MAGKIATRNAYGDALAELAEKYPQLVVLDADLSGATMTKGFAAGVSSCCTSCGNPESPGKMNSAAIARFLMVLFIGRFLSLRCL